MKNVLKNYKALVQEISEETAEGVLSPQDTIQILRGKEAVMEGYYPIVDWYYDAYVMQEEMDIPMEEQYLPEEFTKEEWAQLVKEQEEFRQQYEADKPDLVEMKVKDALTEMKQIQKLLGSKGI